MNCILSSFCSVFYLHPWVFVHHSDWSLPAIHCWHDAGINIFLDGFSPSPYWKLAFLQGVPLLHKSRNCDVMLSKNGTWKTTFVHLLAGDELDESADRQSVAMSLKPQTISPKFWLAWHHLHAIVDADQGCLYACTVPERHCKANEHRECPQSGSQDVVKWRASAHGHCAGNGKAQHGHLPHWQALFVGVFCSIFGRLAPELSAFQLLGFRVVHDYSKGHQMFHPPHEEDTFVSSMISSLWLTLLTVLLSSRAPQLSLPMPQSLLMGINKFLQLLEISSVMTQLPPMCEQTQFGQGLQMLFNGL